MTIYTVGHSNILVERFVDLLMFAADSTAGRYPQSALQPFRPAIQSRIFARPRSSMLGLPISISAINSMVAQGMHVITALRVQSITISWRKRRSTERG